MLFLRGLLIVVGSGVLAFVAALLLYDLTLAYDVDRLVRRVLSKTPPEEAPRTRRGIRWNEGGKLAGFACAGLLIAKSIVVVPAGLAGVRISQISGILPTTLYPGVHFVLPLVQRVATFDTRDQVFATAAEESAKQNEPVLKVEAQEGLPLGLSVEVRYRLDPSRLAYVEANLPQPVGEEIVAPVVESAFREVAPDYMVRDVFASKRYEFHQRVAGLIAARLAPDAIEVKEVLVRRIVLPPDYAQGLESLLLKEQESERMNFEQEIQEKQVKIAEYQADANKVRFVKQAEANAESRVIAAKAESDAMQYTLPLKQKQIEQARLEAKARKEATLENAEAEAQAQVINSQAEEQSQELLAKAEADRIRVTGAAEAQQMQLEAAALKGNPLLIQKIVAEKLSDKVRIMMVPMDGKFFFTNSVLDAPLAAASDPPAGARTSGGANGNPQ